jgi:excisionase family DNA binding protein
MSDNSGIQNQYVSIREVCTITGLSRTFIARRLATGELASRKIGRRRLISRAALADFLEGIK